MHKGLKRLSLLCLLCATACAPLPQAEANRRLLQALQERDDGKAAGLVRRGADPNLRRERVPVLVLAAEGGCPDTISALLEKGAAVDGSDDQGWTALLAAIDVADLHSVRLLLQAGANPNRQYRVSLRTSGRTTSGSPLLLAVIRNQPWIVRLLLEKGADPGFKTKAWGLTPARVARVQGYHEILQLLETFPRKTRARRPPA